MTANQRKVYDSLSSNEDFKYKGGRKRGREDDEDGTVGTLHPNKKQKK